MYDTIQRNVELPEADCFPKATRPEVFIPLPPHNFSISYSLHCQPFAVTFNIVRLVCPCDKLLFLFCYHMSCKHPPRKCLTSEVQKTGKYRLSCDR